MTRLEVKSGVHATHSSSPIQPSRQRRKISGQVRIWVWIVVTVAIATTAIAVCFNASLYRIMRQSFTRMPTTYTELYFTRTPTTRRGEVAVPVSLVRHGSGEVPYRLRVSLVAADGRVTTTTIVTVAAKPGAQAGTVVRLPVRRHAVIVNVALLGHTQAVHYRLDNSRTPVPEVPR
jgi:hypothetical protein